MRFVGDCIRVIPIICSSVGTAHKARPASAAYVKAAIADWSKEPFIHGAYSYPSLGAHCRAPVLIPVGNCDNLSVVAQAFLSL